jgi:membrane fusion protein (multidrug efflux system)
MNLKKIKTFLIVSITILLGLNVYLFYLKSPNLNKKFWDAKNFITEQSANILTKYTTSPADIKKQKNKKPEKPEKTEKFVNIFKIKKVDFKDSLTNLIGTIEGTNFSIKVDQEEIVEKIHFRTGDFVKKNTLILELNHTKMQAELSKARIELEKTKELFKVGGASKFLLDAMVEEMKVAERNYASTFVKAPSDGFIGEILVKEGEFAVKYKPIVRFVNCENEFYIRTKVIEKKMPFILAQNKVNVKVNFSENRIQGYVALIAPEIDPFSRMFDVYVKIDDAYKKYLKPGMSAELEIMIFDKNTAIMPISCLADGIKNGIGKVFTLDKNKKAKAVKVSLGYKTREYIEVLGGLNEGELIITDVEKSKIADGDRIISDKPKEFETETGTASETSETGSEKEQKND